MPANIVPVPGWTPAFAGVTEETRDAAVSRSSRNAAVTPAKAGVHAAAGTARADDATDEAPS